MGGFERRHPEVTFTVAIGSLAQGYGEAVDLTVFRCVQEALTNAMKHGGASRVSIDLREEQGAPNGTGEPVGKLRLVVHDNGRGFAAGASMGMGMTAMRERVRGIGGSSNIDSARGHGTTLTVYVPLRADKNAKTVTVKEVEGAI